MRRDNLSEVGKKLREIRKAKGLNLKDVADKAGITAGLLSRIENFRTIPSLPVLYEISMALEVTMADVVQAVKGDIDTDYVLIKSGEGEIQEREDSEDLEYIKLFSETIKNQNISAYIVRVKPYANREPISNDSFELIYVASGEIVYGLNDTEVPLVKGDALFFDGKIPHSVLNTGDKEAILFKIYLMQIE